MLIRKIISIFYHFELFNKIYKKRFLKQLKQLVLALGLFTFSINTEDVKKVILEQIVGEFTVKELKSSEGDYIFEITNNGVDHAGRLVIG